jgi:radical SAM protein with 4Fe4S-binding SPASM domain
MNSAAERPLIDASTPKWIFLQLLENCNLRCRMCYEWGDSGAYKNKAHLKRLELEEVLTVIEEFKNEKPYYELFGGEPLLYPRIDRVLAAIRDAGSLVHIPTNGTLLSDHVEMLIDTAPHRIWVSLDGPPDINDAQRGDGVFAKAIAGIELLHQRRTTQGRDRPQICVSTVVTNINQHALSDLFLKSLDLAMIDAVSIELQAFLTPGEHHSYVALIQQRWGVDGAPIASGFVSQPHAFDGMDAEMIAAQIRDISRECERRGIYLNTYPRALTAANIRSYFAARRSEVEGAKPRCPFPWISAEISANGDVTTCHAFYDVSLGNIRQTSLRDIWRGEAYKKFRADLRKGLLPICPACCLYYNNGSPL